MGEINFTAGTFRITDDYLLDDRLLDSVLGSAHTIGPLQHFAVAGKATMETPLFLNGGTFSAGLLVPGSPLFFNSGTFNLTTDDLVIGPGGLFGDTLALSNRNVNVTNTTTIQPGARLLLQGGAFSAGTLINQGTIDFQDQSSQVSGGLLTNTGTIRGTGTILHNIQNNTAGQIQTTAGQRLEFGGTVNNGGLISLVGGQMQFNQAVTNAANTGLITAREGIVRFNGGLANNGSLTVAFGTADIFGEITNAPSGRVVVSGGAQATFYEDVTNNGSINVSASGPMQSTAIFLGSLQGNGIAGGGHVFIEGDARPGFSAGVMAFGGDVSFGPLCELSLEIGGHVPGGEFDRVVVADDAFLAGTLAVSTINDFSPSLPGQSFEILAAGSIAGIFDGIIGQLSADLRGLFWIASYTSTTVTLSTSALPGDIDLNGEVDRADASLFTPHLGITAGATWITGDFDADGATTVADLTLLQANLGQSIAPSASVAAVPEPSTWLAFLIPAPAMFLFRQRHRWRWAAPSTVSVTSVADL
jgi:hypothetical protein